MQRRRFNQSESLERRLSKEARFLREQGELLPHGPVRDAVSSYLRITVIPGCYVGRDVCMRDTSLATHLR